MRRSLVRKSLLHCLHSYATILFSALGGAKTLEDVVGTLSTDRDLPGEDMLDNGFLKVMSRDGVVLESGCSSLILEAGGGCTASAGLHT